MPIGAISFAKLASNFSFNDLKYMGKVLGDH